MGKLWLTSWAVAILPARCCAGLVADWWWKGGDYGH